MPVFPILNPPPSSLPIPSLWVVPVYQPQASSIVHRIWTGNSFHTWYYTCFNAILPNLHILFLITDFIYLPNIDVLLVSLQYFFNIFIPAHYWIFRQAFQMPKTVLFINLPMATLILLLYLMTFLLTRLICWPSFLYISELCLLDNYTTHTYPHTHKENG